MDKVERTCPQVQAYLLEAAEGGSNVILYPKEARAAGLAMKLVAEEGWPDTLAMTPPEIVGRMVALVREIGAQPDGGEIWGRSTQLKSFSAEACAILAELEPDGDLVEARRICQEQSPHTPFAYRDAGPRHNETMRAVLVALKRGRELEASK